MGPGLPAGASGVDPLFMKRNPPAITNTTAPAIIALTAVGERSCFIRLFRGAPISAPERFPISRVSGPEVGALRSEDLALGNRSGVAVQVAGNDAIAVSSARAVHLV